MVPEMRKSWISSTKRPRSIALAASAGLLVALFGLWHLSAVPSWLRNEWAPDNALMRYLYQCAGTREQEQLRWLPNRLLISACDGPVQLAMSPSQERVLVWVRSSNEYRVYDVASGEPVFVTSSVPYFDGGFIGEDYLVLEAGKGGPEPEITGTNLIDIATGARVQTMIGDSSDEHLSELEAAYAESNGRVIQVDGAIKVLLFMDPTGIREAYEYIHMVGFYPSVRELVATWSPETLEYRIDNLKDERVFGGGESCVLGDNSYPGDQNPWTSPTAPICLLKYANPVWLAD